DRWAAGDAGGLDELVRDALRVAGLQRLGRVVENVAGEVGRAGGGGEAVSGLRARPAAVAVHRVVAPDDGADAPDADLSGLRLEVADVARAGLGIGVAPVGEGVDPDLVLGQPLAGGQFEKRVEVAEVRVDAAVG